MRKRRYEILLPLRFNDGSPIQEDALAHTKDEILERKHYEDELVRFVIDVEDTGEN